MTLKNLSLLVKIIALTTLIIVMLFGSCNVSYAQVNSVSFTPVEVEQLAKQNLERKKCLELNDINERYIDSLNLKMNLLEQQLKLKDTTIGNFKSIVNNYDQIDSLRVKQASNLLDDNEDQKRTIKKQNRKLNFWRIFTPVTITIVAIGSIFIK
jgi:hypothetical protein